MKVHPFPIKDRASLKNLTMKFSYSIMIMYHIIVRGGLKKTSTKFVHSCVRLKEGNNFLETIKIQKLKIPNPLEYLKIPLNSLESFRIP